MANILELFTKESGLYVKNLRFETLAFLIFISALFMIYTPKTYGFVIILLAFLYFVGNIYVQIKTSTIEDFNKITMFKLNSLQDIQNKYVSSLSFLNKKLMNQMLTKNKLDCLYLDANLISFLYSILELNTYNPQEFYIFLKGINNILCIRKQIEDFYKANNQLPENISEMFEISLQLKTNVINNLQNFIYSIPKSNKMYNYLNDVLSRFIVLISRNTDIIHFYYKKSLKINKISTMTKFISYDTTKPFDQLSNHYSTHSKLIDYYV
jgi:hypothetical protein